MFTFRPRDASGLQVGIRRTSTVREDGGDEVSSDSEIEVEERIPDDEVFVPTESEDEQEEPAQAESGLSRSQKRRRRRR
jgi:hypothetical protein